MDQRTAACRAAAVRERYPDRCAIARECELIVHFLGHLQVPLGQCAGHGQWATGETVSEAVAREVLEETGIEVDVSDMVGVFSNPEHVIAYDDGEVRQEFSTCFRARPTGGTLRTSEESKEVLWVAPATLESLDVHPSIKLRIEHGLASAAPYFT